jgi:hypothetical protein
VWLRVGPCDVEGGLRGSGLGERSEGAWMVHTWTRETGMGVRDDGVGRECGLDGVGGWSKLWCSAMMGGMSRAQGKSEGARFLSAAHIRYHIVSALDFYYH